MAENEIVEQDESVEVKELLLGIQEQGQKVEAFVNNQIKLKDEWIDKMHRELDGYRNGAAEKSVDELIKQVIKVKRGMVRLAGDEKWESMSADEVRRQYEYLIEDITDLLELQNVDSYVTPEGEPFDASIHQCKVETTDDESLDKRVKMSVSEGYKKGDRVLIPERVVVYKYNEKTED